MSRVRPFAIVLVLSTLVSFVPQPSQAETRFGPIAGLNIADLNIDGRSGLNVRTTLGAGVAVDIGLNPRFGIRIEPTFLSKGAKAEEYNAYWATVNSAVFELNYIDIPVLARYDLATSETRGYLIAGPAVGFATQRQVVLTQNNVSQTVDFADVLTSTDVSVVVGAGIAFGPWGNRMTLDGRVAFGVVNINDGGTVTFDGAPLDVPAIDTKTLDFRLMATYLFPIPGH